MGIKTKSKNDTFFFPAMLLEQDRFFDQQVRVMRRK